MMQKLNFVRNLENVRFRSVRDGAGVVLGLLDAPICVKQNIHTVAFPVIYYVVRQVN